MGIGSSRVDAFQTQNPLRPERPPITGQSGLEALQRAEAIDGYRKQVASSSINLWICVRDRNGTRSTM